jgi:hypothetical protein
MPHGGRPGDAHPRPMSAERMILSFVALCLIAFFVAVLVLPHHPPG